MIQSARAAITNTSNEQALADFSQNSDNVSLLLVSISLYDSVYVLIVNSKQCSLVYIFVFLNIAPQGINN